MGLEDLEHCWEVIRAEEWALLVDLRWRKRWYFHEPIKKIRGSVFTQRVNQPPENFESTDYEVYFNYCSSDCDGYPTNLFRTQRLASSAKRSKSVPKSFAVSSPLHAPAISTSCSTTLLRTLQTLQLSLGDTSRTPETHLVSCNLLKRREKFLLGDLCPGHFGNIPKTWNSSFAYWAFWIICQMHKFWSTEFAA